MSPILTRQRQVARLKAQITHDLCEALNLYEVHAPLLVPANSGLQDTLSGRERAVKVHVSAEQKHYEVVHSLAKWKRSVLAAHQVPVGAGILAQMTALRPDEERISERHAVQVDQWDWEQVISPSQRNLATLRATVTSIYQVLRRAALICLQPTQVAESVFFVHSEELRQMYPALTPKEREHEITKMHKAVFIIGIGQELKDGVAHDDRAADYDDWSSFNDDGYSGLNGDLLVWHDGLQDALELSSMGIRVDATALKRQIAQRASSTATGQRTLQQPWHQSLLQGGLPSTIGGGIGQSRVAMWLQQSSHIREVQFPTTLSA
ncbi:aspartate--ammonia ligase [Pseudidiomarina salilacus]|uniref:aspartate--ammonia ligase n=1 Tax=Pseudidiomarina salilacus TaxID=3384452 RepID=UPI003984B29B